MLFEVLGFVSGIAVIGTVWMLLLRHERWKVMEGFYRQSPNRPPEGNALIWPSR